MSRERDTYRYVLRNGRDIVQYGVTDNPEAREQEHQRKHNNADLSLTVEGPAVARESALAWERVRIEQFCRAHDGKKPRYNKV